MAARLSPVKEQILEVATRLMAVRGYHRTALDDVLRESGAGKGNFYHYFRSKEDLGYAILDRLFERVEARTLRPIFGDPERPPLDQVEAFLDQVLATQRAGTASGAAPSATSPPSSPTPMRAFASGWPAGSSAGDMPGGGAPARPRERRPHGRGRARAVARFLVAGIEGAILLTKVQKDIRVMEHCVAELRRHLAFYRCEDAPVAAERAAMTTDGAPASCRPRRRTSGSTRICSPTRPARWRRSSIAMA